MAKENPLENLSQADLRRVLEDTHAEANPENYPELMAEGGDDSHPQRREKHWG